MSPVAAALLAHLVGDYLLQSDWMATQKTRRWWPAIAHATTYGAPFLLVTSSVEALAVIIVTHAVIDHYRLARYVVWLKNHLAPPGYNPPWRDCAATGYPPDRPIWLTTWLLFIADNILHISINTAAVLYL